MENTSSILTVTVTVDQAEAIRRGMVLPKTATEAERAELAALTLRDGLDSPLHASDTRDYGSVYPACLPTAESVLAMIRSALARRAERKTMTEAEAKANAEAGLAAAQKALALPLEAWIAQKNEEWRMVAPGYEIRYGDAYWSSPGIAERTKEAEAECRRRNAQIQQERKEAEKRKEAERHAAEERLKSWALAHGSELLRERIAGGYKWISLAHDEFFNAHLPTGYGEEFEVDHCEDRTCPTLAEIVAHKEAQKLCADNPGLYRDPVFFYNTVDADPDEEDDSPTHFTSVRITIVCPDGHCMYAERKVQN
jgi:hypothetical protein